jgi:hypothetical protein
MTLVLDEAHKYLTNADADRFNQSLCSIIRQQRHLAARIIISTQEPTVVPSSMLDLLSYIICHRFQSPSWVRHLSAHISTPPSTTTGAQSSGDAVVGLEAEEAPLSGNISTHISTTTGAQSWGDVVIGLETGEALLFSPNALCADGSGQPVKLGNGHVHLFTRPRITRDGGQSILAVGSVADTSDGATDSGPSSPEHST